MRDTVRAALESRVAIGAHPGYDDREGFGRRELGLPEARIAELVRAQCAALLDVLAQTGGSMQHIKLHGALYHRAGRDRAVAEAVADAVITLDPRVIVVGMPRSYLAIACAARGLAYAREAFADRGYAVDGSLLPRSDPGGLVAPGALAARAVRLVLEGNVDGVSQGGTAGVHVPFDTLCLHSDTPHAADGAARIRRALDEAGVTVAPLSATLRR